MNAQNVINLAEALQDENTEEVKKFFSNLLEGHRVEKVEDDTLILDNGMKLTMFESEQDCCASAYGDWEILEEAHEMGITDVDVEVEVDYREDDYYDKHLNITILHDNNPIVKGHGVADAGDGGYYFSTLSLRVEIPNQEAVETKLLYS